MRNISLQHNLNFSPFHSNYHEHVHYNIYPPLHGNLSTSNAKTCRKHFYAMKRQSLFRLIPAIQMCICCINKCENECCTLAHEAEPQKRAKKPRQNGHKFFSHQGSCKKTVPLPNRKQIKNCSAFAAATICGSKCMQSAARQPSSRAINDTASQIDCAT